MNQRNQVAKGVTLDGRPCLLIDTGALIVELSHSGADPKRLEKLIDSIVSENHTKEN